VIQAYRIASEDDIRRARESAADYILLDHGTGTGQTFDWNLVRGIGRPFFLAGGLGPDNLREAVSRMEPFAVDMSSSVETDKVKDREKILAAVRAVRGGK
jgi:phosphoribosylanthranilate isomerase